MSRLWGELRRRRVIRVCIAYAVVSWLLLQVGAILFPAFDAPIWSIKALTLVLIIGLPITIILSWIFDITPEGIVVTDQEKQNSTSNFSYSKLKPLNIEKLSLSKVQLSELSGRSEELELLRAKILKTKEGLGGIILISGESGQGKTRLGEEALNIAKDMGVLPLVGHAYEDQGAPYIVATEILEEITRVLPETTLRNVLGNSAAEITRLVPDLHRIFPDIPKPIDLPPGQQQRFMFNAVLDMIIRLSSANPLIMLLDDLHWADESSIQLLEHFIPHLAKHPILFVITFRDTEIDHGEPFKKALTKLHKLQSVNQINLKQFSLEEVEKFLSNATGKPPPIELSQLIFRETNGNVFFVQSVVQQLMDENKLFDESDNWLTEFSLMKKIDVPYSVRLVTEQRIKKLNESTQETLRTAAVLGYRFKIKELENSSIVAENVLFSIEEAEAANLIKPTHAGYGLRYEFVHSLTRQALLTQLSTPRKQQLHYIVSQAIEKSDTLNLEQRAADIAYHLMQSGEHATSDQSLNWLSRAGNHAVQAAAFEEALGFFNSALKIVSHNTQEADLLHQSAKAKLNLGNGEAYTIDMLKAFDLYKTEKNTSGLASICNELSFMMAWNNQSEEAIAFVHSGLKLVGEEVSPARCELLSALGMAHGVSDTPLTGEPFHEQAIEMAQQLDNQDLLAHCLQNIGLMHWATFNGKGLEKAGIQGALLNKELKHDWNLAQCLWMQEAGLTFQGRFNEADTVSGELQPIAKLQDNFGPLLCSELFTSIRYHALGDLPNALNSGNLAIEYCKLSGFPWANAMIGIRSVNKLLAGDFTGAREDFETANLNPLPNGMFAGVDISFYLAGKAFIGDSDTYIAYQQVKEKLPSAKEPLTAGKISLVLGCIEALATISENTEAGKLYPLVNNIIKENNALLGFSFGLFERYAGIAAAAGKDWEQANIHFDKALSQARTLPHRIEEPRIYYWQARMLLNRNDSGDKEKAEQLFSSSRELSKLLNMLGHLDLINRTESQEFKKY